MTEYALDYKKYLDDPKVDAFAVVIQTEPSYQVALDVLRSGKHLFIEKPMASNAQRAEDICRAAEENRRIVHCDHIMVYHPIIRYIKKMVDSGELGDMIYFDVSRINLGPIRMDVNSMLDLAVHDLAVIDYLSGGKEPYHVEAIGEKCYGEQETLTYLTMKYPGFLAHVKSSWISPLKERRVMIGGTKKMLIFDDMRLVDKLTIYDQGIVKKDKGDEYGAYEFKVRTGGHPGAVYSARRRPAQQCGAFCRLRGERPSVPFRPGTGAARNQNSRCGDGETVNASGF